MPGYPHMNLVLFLSLTIRDRIHNTLRHVVLMFPQGGILEYFYIESNTVFHFPSSDSIKDKFTKFTQ